MFCESWESPPSFRNQTPDLLVEGLGVGGGGRDVGVTGSLVRAGGELELVGARGRYRRSPRGLKGSETSLLIWLRR